MPVSAGRNLGPIQRIILSYIDSRDKGHGVYIGQAAVANELADLWWEQVERSLSKLLRRGVIRKEGIRYLRRRASQTGGETK